MAKRPPPDGRHIVSDGEWVGSVSILYGYADWDKDVWCHPNNGDLQELRKDPHVLGEGDVLFIPPWEEKSEACATEKKHKFKLKVPSEVLRFRMIDKDGKPLKNLKYTLEIDYKPGGGVYKQKGEETDGDGVLQEKIPSTAVGGRLRFPALGYEFVLNLGFLTPMDLADKGKLIRGAQERLRALGFYRGEIDALENTQFEAAVAAFQKFCKENCDKGDPNVIDAGPSNGLVGELTRAALLKYYQS